MKRLIEKLKLMFTRKPRLQQPVVSSSVTSCGCNGKQMYECDIFGMRKESVKMKLCKEHIKEKCEEGLLVAL